MLVSDDMVLETSSVASSIISTASETVSLAALAIKPNALKWFANIISGKANLIISVLARTDLEQIQTLNSDSSY